MRLNIPGVLSCLRKAYSEGVSRQDTETFLRGVLPVSWWEIGGLRVSGQTVLARLDSDEQVGGEQRGPQGAAS